MWKKTLAIAVCVISVAGSCVLADTPVPVVGADPNSHTRRTRHSVKNGALTKPQEHKLSAEVDDIRKEKRDMIKANGGKPLTSEQRKQLRQKQEQNSQKLLQQNNAATTIPSGAAK